MLYTENVKYHALPGKSTNQTNCW